MGTQHLTVKLTTRMCGLSALFLLSYISFVRARGCPSLNEVDIYRNETLPGGPPKAEWIAGRWYSEPGHVNPELACKGNMKEALKDEGDLRPSGDGEPMGSLLIYPGCKIYVYEEPDFEGEFKEYTGPAIMSNPHYEFGWACWSDHSTPMLCPRSYLWSCQQIMPDCQPEDGWNSITYLDNSQSSSPTTFTFSYTIGITWGPNEQISADISTAIKNTMTLHLIELFAYTLEISVTTGYDWSTWSDNKTVTGSAEVPAGEKVEIQAVVGYCGNNMVETEMFRIVSTRTGKVLDYKNKK